MIVAALMALVEPWVSCVRGVVAPLSWLQYNLSRATRRADAAVRGLGEDGAELDASSLKAENEALRRQLVHQQLMYTDLERELATVTGLREQLRDSGAKILIAPVVAYDASPRRESLTIGLGSERGIKKEQWVAAGAAPREDPDMVYGRELLARQWLIGRISEAWPNTARVQLATDVGFGPVYVRAARTLEDGRLEPIEQNCLLRGRGAGRMLIDRATGDYYSDGCRLVIAMPTAGLPAPLLIGEIKGSASIDGAPQHFNLDVQPCGNVRMLGHVYVIVPGA